MILQASLPELDQFYKGKIPAFQVMIYMQLVSTAPKWRYAVLVGMVFSILGGIAPLLPPNNLMPAVIRVGHGFEVGISNFLFGWITGVVLYRGKTMLIGVDNLNDRIIEVSAQSIGHCLLYCSRCKSYSPY